MTYLSMFLAVFFMSSSLHAQSSCEEALASSLPKQLSPLISGTNKAGHFKKTIGRMEKDLRKKIEAILAVAPEKRSFANTILATDEALDRFAAEGNVLHTVAQLIPTTKKKEAEITDFNTRFFGGLNDIVVNADLFKAIEATPAADGEEAELKAALIRRFEETGATLPPDTRTKLSELVAKRAGLNAAYRLDLQNDPSSVDLTLAELDGVPKELFEKFHQQDGRIRLPVKKPALVTEVIKQANQESTRQKVFLAYRSRLPQNMDRLLHITHLNSEIAALQGHSSHLEKAVNPRSLAGGPKNVERLLNDLASGVKVGIKNRFAQMSEMKKAEGSNLPLAPWDHYYYEAKLQAQEQKTVPDVSKYFQAKTFLNPFFQTLKQMFRIDFNEVTGEPVWHPSVKLFRVTNLRTDETMGYMYMDLYSREGKPDSTAFVEELISRRRSENRLPVMAFITNWGEEAEGLSVSVGEVQTALHEMGHALHGLIQEGPYYAVSGWSHPQDMMEVPSTSLDRMIKEPEMVQALSAKDGDINQKMPIELAKEIADSQKGFRILDGDFHSSSHEMNTVFLSLFDIAVQKAAPTLKSGEDILRIYREEYEKFYGFAPPPEDHFPQTFHHIAGEYAGYYASYIVAGVSAANNVERFKELGGILNPNAIRMWWDEALSVPQYTRTASDIQEGFWKHPVSATPIFEELGLPLPTE